MMEVILPGAIGVSVGLLVACVFMFAYDCWRKSKP